MAAQARKVMRLVCLRASALLRVRLWFSCCAAGSVGTEMAHCLAQHNHLDPKQMTQGLSSSAHCCCASSQVVVGAGQVLMTPHTVPLMALTASLQPTEPASPCRL